MEIMRNVLITGGTGKIGSVLVKSMLNDGHTVVFTTTDKKKGVELIGELNADISKLFCVESKFENETSVEKLINELPFEIDTVIYNARSLDSLKMNEEGMLTEAQFTAEFFMAVTFPYLLSNRLLKLNTSFSDIIFISSMYGTVAPSPHLYDDFERQSPINYGVAKAAQIHLCKELAVRFAKKNIRVNSISFGGVKGRASEDFILRYNKLTPMGRMLDDSDLYPPIQYILNNPKLAITGENIKIDGGWTIW
jgi:NAD(P)-dependent dehydrogenase (short-subunit alcohol dehydrogenase family)